MGAPLRSDNRVKRKSCRINRKVIAAAAAAPVAAPAVEEVKEYVLVYFLFCQISSLEVLLYIHS